MQTLPICRIVAKIGHSTMKISHDTKRENSTSPKKQDQRCLCKLREEFGVRGFMAQKMVVKHSQKKKDNIGRQWSLAQRTQRLAP